MVRDSAQDMLDTITEVERGMSYFGTWGWAPSIPGSSRQAWQANIDKLLSGKILNLMTEMKNASRTGATGFGQLSEKELKVLQDSSTALKRTLSQENAQKILDDMKIKLQKVIKERTQTSPEEMETIYVD